jgi:hypothetical protein
MLLKRSVPATHRTVAEYIQSSNALMPVTWALKEASPRRQIAVVDYKAEAVICGSQLDIPLISVLPEKKALLLLFNPIHTQYGSRHGKDSRIPLQMRFSKLLFAREKKQTDGGNA